MPVVESDFRRSSRGVTALLDRVLVVMTSEEYRTWQARYREREFPDTPRPELESLLRAVSTTGAQTTLALDVAAGAGRHSRLLASLGYRVHALDISPEGLRILRERTGPDVDCAAYDLTQFVYPTSMYDLLLCVDYLDRRLLSNHQTLLRSGGMAVFSLRVCGTQPGRFRIDLVELLGHLEPAVPEYLELQGERVTLAVRKTHRVTGLHSRLAAPRPDRPGRW